MDKCGKSSGQGVVVGLVGKLVDLLDDIMFNLAQRLLNPATSGFLILPTLTYLVDRQTHPNRLSH